MSANSTLSLSEVAAILRVIIILTETILTSTRFHPFVMRRVLCLHVFSADNTERSMSVRPLFATETAFGHSIGTENTSFRSERSLHIVQAIKNCLHGPKRLGPYFAAIQPKKSGFPWAALTLITASPETPA